MQAQCMNQFEKTVIALEGEEKGKQWLADLPHVLKKLSKQWNISNLKVMESLTYNYLLTGLQGNKPIVIKICPDPKEFEEELHALQLLACPSLLKIFAYDKKYSAILMEQAIPGITLHTLFPHQDSESITIVCDIIQNLPRITPTKKEFDLHSKWFPVLDEDYPTIPHSYLAKARTLEKLLIQTASEPLTLCHGDLHHGNIVKNGSHWIAIDPFPVFGERAFEISRCMWWPYQALGKLSESEFSSLLKNRIIIASHRLTIDAERIQRWCYVLAVTAWAWCHKSGRVSTEIEKITHFLDPLTPDNLETPSSLCH
jgi:streptomycin 6-kinase